MTEPGRTEHLREIGLAILTRLESASRSRDRALNEGRQIVRISANSIRAIHRGELENARDQLHQARAMLDALTKSLDDLPAIRWAGYTQDAMKELAEASILLAIASNGPIPSPEELSVDDAPYLNALAESASELRRSTLDKLRSRSFADAERNLEIMDEIYRYLVTVDYPDGLTGGLRRSTDALRAVLERTRGDLTITGAQQQLFDALQRANEQVGKGD